jgi:GR25 family glycosyltransferase involved in LPS biosynthesis
MDLGVDKVYVINLKRHKLRRNNIQSQADQWGFDFEFVEGYDNQDYRNDPEFFKNMNEVFWDPAGRCTLAILCCAMSHRKAYKQFLDSGAETALFLEDDVEFTNRVYEYDFSEVRNELNMLEWGVCWYGKYVESIYKNDRISKHFFNAARHHGGQYAGHAYVLNRKSAQWFYDNTEKVKFAADVRLEFSPFLHITVGKSIFIQKHIHHYLDNVMVEKEFMHYTLEDADNPDGWDKNIKTSRFMKPKSYRQSNRGFQTKVLHGWEFFF